MADRTSMKHVFEYQSGGYPMEQVLVLEVEDNGVKVPSVCAFFADAEMDVFRVSYGPEGAITIHAEGVEYIETGPHQLSQIAALASEAEVLNEELANFMDDDAETWLGHDHLITKPNLN